MPPAPRLSRRQLEVLQHVALGEQDKEIAKALHISTITVKSHMKSIFIRLCVHNRTRAVLAAKSAGLLDL